MIMCCACVVLLPVPKRSRTARNCSAEKKTLKADYDEMAARSESERQDEEDVAEFISHLKHYAGATELTREMCLDLIEYATVDENNKGHKDRPRVIHVYYKLIDKPLTNKNRLALT